MSAELGLAGANAARSAAALQESLASGHISTEKLSEYQERAKKILESDSPAREIAGAVSGPFLERGIHSNIERIGNALNRRYRKPVERAIQQVQQEVGDRVGQLQQGFNDMVESVPGRLNAFLPNRIPPESQLGFDPQNVAGDLGSGARTDAQNAARNAAARLNDFTEDGNYEGNGLKALEDAVKAAPRGVQAGETLTPEANTVANFSRIGSRKAPLGVDLAEDKAARFAARGRSAAATKAYSMSRTPQGGLENYNLDEVQRQHVAGPSTEAPATAGSREFEPIQTDDLSSLEDSILQRQVRRAARQAETEELKRQITAKLQSAQESQGSAPGSPPQDPLREQLASEQHLISGDTSNASELGLQSARPTDNGATPSSATDAGENIAEDATREGAVTTADAAASDSSKALKAVNALEDSADVVESAAAGEGGANIFADAAALAIGLAGAIAPVLAPKPKLPPPPKPPPAIGTAVGVGV